jgi:hypothetical protein
MVEKGKFYRERLHGVTVTSDRWDGMDSDRVESGSVFVSRPVRRAPPIDVRKSSAFPFASKKLWRPMIYQERLILDHTGGIAAKDSATRYGKAELFRTSSGEAVRAIRSNHLISTITFFNIPVNLNEAL